jgi:hypothetical protein
LLLLVGCSAAAQPPIPSRSAGAPAAPVAPSAVTPVESRVSVPPEAPKEDVAIPEVTEPVHVAWTGALPEDPLQGRACREFRRERPARPAAALRCDSLAEARTVRASILAPFANAQVEIERHAGDCVVRGDPSFGDKVQVHLPSPQQIDAALAPLESCRGLPVGFVPALRAHVAGPCADVTAAPFLKAPAPGTEAVWLHLLAGLALAARLDRLQFSPPPFSSRETGAEAATRFLDGEFSPWAKRAEARIESVALDVARLPAESQGGSLARIALANARARLLRARSVRIPDAWKKSVERRQVFYTGLDRVLTPYVEHALASALDAFRAVDTTGLVKPRAPRAFADARQLSRRVQLLHAVLLPRLEPSRLASESAVLAAALPPPFIDGLLAPEELAEPDTLRAALLSGLSSASRERLARLPLVPEARTLLLRFHVLLAIRAASPARARRAVWLASRQGAEGSPESELLTALALALTTLPDISLPGASSSSAPLHPALARLSTYRESVAPALFQAFASFDLGLLRLSASVTPGPQDQIAREALATGARLWPQGESRECLPSDLARGVTWVTICPCPYLAGE